MEDGEKGSGHGDLDMGEVQGGFSEEALSRRSQGC